MTTTPPDLVESLEALRVLLARLEERADPSVRAHAQAVVRGVLDFHRAAIARCLDIVRTGGAEGEGLVQALARDDLVSSMLVLHDLHPASLEARARAALDRGCPNGWRVERVEIQGATVRVKVARVADASRAAEEERVRSWAETALARTVPDADVIEVEGEREALDRAGIVPVDRLRARRVAVEPPR